VHGDDNLGLALGDPDELLPRIQRVEGPSIGSNQEVPFLKADLIPEASGHQASYAQALESTVLGHDGCQ
jgi:hypothetical protein